MNNTNTLERTSNNLKETSNELKLASNFNLSEDEVAGGMDDGGLGYLDQYPYRIRVSGSDFEVIDSKTDVMVWSGKELPCIVYYGHPVYRLLRGTVEGLQGSEKSWPEDMKEIVAMSFGSPFGESQRSRGNFDANGYAQYLDNKELRKLVKKRLYMFVQLPQSLVAGGPLAAATFGGSALIPFGAYHTKIKGLNVPLPLVKTVLYTEKQRNEKNEEYHELRLRPLLTKDGAVAVSVATDDDYRTRLKPVLEKIVETHKFAMRRLESSAERPVTAAAAGRAIAAPAGSAAAIDFAPEEKDEVPSGAFSDESLEF